MLEEWNLHEWKDEILTRWNEINLFQMTRGINRFKGLALALLEIDEKYTKIPGVETLHIWTETTNALSNDALAEAIDVTPEGEGRECLVKALSWSNAVNASIVNLPEELKIPFPGAKAGLAAAHEFADVAVVSSANRGAVDEEWTIHGLYDHVDIVLAQDCGSKAHCIAEMVKFGYALDHVLMVGDAPGDMDAAEKNGVLYFPILVNHEEKSWEELCTTGLSNLKSGSYVGGYQALKRRAFLANLGG
jgi:phosphoglycolate phosphatase-like HAD superfamily hydrolase